MNPLELVASLLSVAPSALLDYAAIAVVLKLPLRLRFAWMLRGFPFALGLMAALHTWQQPIALSGALCLGVVCGARLAQSAADWASRLPHRLRLMRRATA